MHELALADRMVQTAVKIAHERRLTHVGVLHLRLGQRAGVTCEALRYACRIVSDGTLLAETRLEIEEVPVVTRCPNCCTQVKLPDPYLLICPICGSPTTEIIQGKELEIVSVSGDS